jgi:hypothetical protein
MSTSELFSVYWYDPDGKQYRDQYLQSLSDSKVAFDRLVGGPAAKIGIVKRVLVTDSLDCLVCEMTNTETGWEQTA